MSSEWPFGDIPRGRYAAILADPPWNFVTYSESGQGRSASRHYEVMTFEEIASLPVHDVAARNAWLFLWVPGPHLPFGLQPIERWGFRYSGFGFVWAKQNPSGTAYLLANWMRRNGNLIPGISKLIGEERQALFDAQRATRGQLQTYSRRPIDQPLGMFRRGAPVAGAVAGGEGEIAPPAKGAARGMLQFYNWTTGH